VAELRRSIKGGVDRWSVRHGIEEGGGSVRHARGGSGARWARGGRRASPPPPLREASWAAWAT
jgi:hypothetical protein